MKKYSLIIFFLIVFLFSTSQVLAGSNSYGQYGGAIENYSILIDKMVQKPQTTKGGNLEYVDNLSPSDPRFTPGNYIFFRVKIKNTSNIVIRDLKITEFVPSYLVAIEGPGTYIESSKSINWSYAELKPQEERVEILKMQVRNQSELPADKGLMCQLNTVKAEAGNTSDDDSAQFCIEKQVVTSEGVPPAKTPEAGAELYVLLGGALTSLGVGYTLYKKN